MKVTTPCLCLCGNTEIHGLPDMHKLECWVIYVYGEKFVARQVSYHDIRSHVVASISIT